MSKGKDITVTIDAAGILKVILEWVKSIWKR